MTNIYILSVYLSVVVNVSAVQIPANGEVFNFLEFQVVCCAVAVAGLHKVTLATVENDTDFVALFRIEQSVQLFVYRVVDTQTTRLKNDALLPIAVN